MLNIFQIVIAILLIIGVLLQQRGAGLSPVFGGDSSSFRTRRGVEKFVFVVTLILSALFIAAAVLNIALRS